MSVNHSRREFTKTCALVGNRSCFGSCELAISSLQHLWNASAEAQEAQGSGSASGSYKWSLAKFTSRQREEGHRLSYAHV